MASVFDSGLVQQSVDSLLGEDATSHLGPTLVLPLRARDRSLGVLALRRFAGDEDFDDEERDLSETFAAQTALALAYAMERQERERLAVYEDRDRIARDLHDLVIQRLFATGMLLQGVQRAHDLDPAQAARLDQAVDDLDATVREIRTTIFELHELHDEQEPQSLRARVIAEVKMAETGTVGRPALTFSGPVDTVADSAIADHVVAAVREGLSNAQRHAGASAVDVCLEIAERSLTLTVQDDGRGPMPGDRRRSGLANLAQRARSLGGDCSFTSQPDGTGAELRWWIELP